MHFPTTENFLTQVSESHPKLFEANRILPLISVGFKSFVWSWDSQTTDEKKCKILYLEFWLSQDCRFALWSTACRLSRVCILLPAWASKQLKKNHIGVSRPVRIWKRLFLLCLHCSYSLKSRVTAVFSVVFQYFSVLFKELPYTEQVISSLCRWKIKD